MKRLKPTRAALAALVLGAVVAAGTAGGQEADGSLDGVKRIRAYSTAAGHEPRGGLAGRASTIVIDDFVLQSNAPGLSVAIGSAGRVDRQRFTFGSEEAASRLVRFVDGAAAESVLVMSMHQAGAEQGGVRPGAAPAEARRVFQQIGAEVCPLDLGAVSWVYIGVRLPSGWVRLAEAVSLTSGVSASFVADADLRRYEGHRARLVCEGPVSIALLDRWKNASRMPNTVLEGPVALGGRSLRAVLAHPPFEAADLEAYPHGENRLVFEDVPLGPDAVLACSLGLAPAAYGKSDGVEYAIVVDGEVAARRTLNVAGSDPPAWHDWRVDLGEHAGKRVTLELRVAPGESTYFDHAYWAEPVVSWGAAEGPAAGDDDAHRLAFIGHAYAFNGFDKRRYGTYLGWSATDESHGAGGRSVRQRVLTEMSSLRREFNEGLRSRGADRVVWGGDSVYTATPESVEHFSGLLRELQPPAGANQVVLAGNHDAALAWAEPVQGVCAAPPDGEETIGGVRLLYVDTTRSGGRSIVTDRSTCGPDEAWIEVLLGRIESAAAAEDVYGLVLLMHHAPWLAEPGVANVAHESNAWWMERVHAALAGLAEQGLTVLVLAGDGGDYCLAAGQAVDGVQYIVSGQPRFDSDVPNGFVELGWGPSRPGVKVRVLTWRPGEGLRVREPAMGQAWRY